MKTLLKALAPSFVVLASLSSASAAGNEWNRTYCVVGCAVVTKGEMTGPDGIGPGAVAISPKDGFSEVVVYFADPGDNVVRGDIFATDKASLDITYDDGSVRTKACVARRLMDRIDGKYVRPAKSNKAICTVEENSMETEKLFRKRRWVDLKVSVGKATWTGQYDLTGFSRTMDEARHDWENGGREEYEKSNEQVE